LNNKYIKNKNPIDAIVLNNVSLIFFVSFLIKNINTREEIKINTLAYRIVQSTKPSIVQVIKYFLKLILSIKS
ncbi:MAG: hypothetical protein RR447_13910, partial [Algoriella sp.]